jgi:hypothetical protein
MSLWAYDVFVKSGDNWFWVTNPEEFPNGALAASPEGAIEEADANTELPIRVIRRGHPVVKFHGRKAR